MNKEMVEKLRAVKTMPELDGLRMEVVAAATKNENKDFYAIQKEFVAAKNRLDDGWVAIG